MGWESFPGFSESVIEMLLEHTWPGNVRELKNVIERAVYYSENEFHPIEGVLLDPFNSPYRPSTVSSKHKVKIQKEIKPETAIFNEPLDFQESVENHEKELLHHALNKSKFNQKEAAKFLNLNYHQLRHQLKKHNLLS